MKRTVCTARTAALALLVALATLAAPALVTAARADVEPAPAPDDIFAGLADLDDDLVTDDPKPIEDPIAEPETFRRGETSMPAASAHAAPAKKHGSGTPLVATRKVRLAGGGPENVARSGPGEGFAIVGVYPEGQTFPVLAKSGDWYNVRLTPSETGWFHASLCEEFEDLSDLEFRPNPKLYSRTGSFMLSGYAGAYAFDRKSNSLTLGGRLGYYVLDRLHAEMGFGWTRITRPAEIVESLFELELEAEKFHMAFYDLGATFEILPGRQMVPFVTGGAGSSIMQGRSELSFNYGAGTMLYLSKRNAMRWEVRAYRFTSGSEDNRQTNTNIAFTLGTSILF
jgi:outer membrane beta-barrel protein